MGRLGHQHLELGLGWQHGGAGVNGVGRVREMWIGAGRHKKALGLGKP